MKKLATGAVLGVLLIVVMGVVQSVSAADTALAERLTRLGLEVIEEVPAGITPLELKTLGEVRSLLRSGCSDRVVLTERLELSVGGEQTAVTRAIDIRQLHYSYICNPVWRTRFNLWADVYVEASGSFHWIDDVRSIRVGLTGLHPFMRLVDTYTDDYIYSNQQRVRIEGGGTLEYYLFIQGILTCYSEPAYIVAYYLI